jgi:enoyl-CoA hydratase/carnithine racemase
MLSQRTEDDILILTLDHGKDNSLTAEFYTTMRYLIKKVNSAPSPKGIILTGQGRFFSSGFNLPMFLGFKDVKEVAAFFRDLEEPVLLDLFTCSKPVVAALNGHTVAGGLIIAMACDYRIATRNPKAKYGMSEIKIGLPLAVAQGEIVRFGMANDRNYRDLVYFGQMLGVERAREINMVDEIVEESELIPRAKQVVSAWIDNPGRAFTPIKKLLRGTLAARLRADAAGMDWEKSLACFSQEDVRKKLEFVQASMAK